MKTPLPGILSCSLFLFLLFPSLVAQNYLTVNNPQAWWEESMGVIKEATISVRPSGIYTEIGLFLTLSSLDRSFDPQAQLEIVYDFALPKNSLINDSWLWVGDSIVKADIRDRWSASFIYEGIVQRRQDPSILYKLYEDNSQTVYQLRVYPLFQDDVRKVKISYLVPTSFTASGQQIPLPMEMLTASGIIPDRVRLLVWPDEDWQSPSIAEEERIAFVSKQTETGSPFLETELSEYFGRSLSLKFPSVLQESIFLKTYESSEDNYYQLVYLPTLDEDIQSPSKLSFVLDYVSRPTTVTKEEFLTQTTEFLLSNLSPSDSFNIFYPTLSVNQASTTWLSGSDENITDVMTTVSNRLQVEFSLLPSLLNTAFTFSQRDESSDIFLISSSDDFESIEKANGIVEALQEDYEVFPSIFIANLANRARFAFWRNGINYFGNDYLYTLLTQLSGGEISSLASELTNINEVLQDGLTNMNGSFESFDLHTSVAYGFCYARFSMNPLSLASPYSAIRQVGKYKGEFPFEITVAGEFKDSLFFKEYSLFPLSNPTPLDSLSRSIWAGLQIREWEKGTLTNEIIQNIMALSLETRVLSEYTAFLALEPSDTTAPCATDDCFDETAIPVSLNQQLEKDLALTLAPNPFTDRLTIEGYLLPGTSTPSVRILDLLGREVKVLAIEVAAEKWSASWDGKTLAGTYVSQGMYFLQVEVNGQSILKRVIKQ